MDVLFSFRGQTFVWNGMKSSENWKKHGIRFEVAVEAFFDPASADEDASVESETRRAVIGRTLQDDLLYVVHVEREGEWLRIISARSANFRETRLYEDGC